MIEDIREVNYKNYEHPIRKVEAQERVIHEDLIFTEDGILLITRVDLSMQHKKKIYGKSTPITIDREFSIYNKASIREIWVWWESTFRIGFIRLVFDSRRTSKKFESKFIPSWGE